MTQNKKHTHAATPHGKHASHQADPYHVVVDTDWRPPEKSLFSSHHHGSIKSGIKAFEVTHAPVAESVQPMPAAIRQAYHELVELAQLASDAAIARLEMLAERHPGVGVLNNLLAAAYSRCGRMREAAVIVERNYREAPEYLFARVQFAQMCLASGRVRDVPQIFDHHFDLKLLYPQRTKYHISEFAAFAAVAGEYHYKIGDHHAAKGYYDTLRHVAPDHELTERLHEMMNQN